LVVSAKPLRLERLKRCARGAVRAWRRAPKRDSDLLRILNVFELLEAALGKSPRPDSDVALIAKKAG